MGAGDGPAGANGSANGVGVQGQTEKVKAAAADEFVEQILVSATGEQKDGGAGGSAGESRDGGAPVQTGELALVKDDGGGAALLGLERGSEAAGDGELPAGLAEDGF